MLNFKSLKTHLGLTYQDGRAVASGAIEAFLGGGTIFLFHICLAFACGFDLAYLIVCVRAIIVASSVAKIIEHCSTFGLKLNFF